MATIPVVQSQARLRTGPANVELSPSIAAGQAQDYGAGFRAIASAAGDMISAQAAFEEKQRNARNAVDLMKANTAATRDINDFADAIEKNGDFRNGTAQFDEGINKRIQERAATIADPITRERFTSHAMGLAESRRTALRDRLFKLESNDAQATLDETLETTAKAAAQSIDPAERQRLEAQAAKSIKDMRDAGYIEPTVATNLFQKFKGSTARVTAERMLNMDPVRFERFIADPNNLPDLNPLDRERLATRAGTLIDRAERRAIAQEDRNLRRAEHALMLEGRAAAKELWGLHSPDPTRNQLTLDAVEARKRELDPGEYKALRRAAQGEAVIDNPESLIRLQPLLDKPGGPAAVDAAMANGELTPTTYLALRNRSVTLNADDKPQSPYKAGRTFIEKALDPGQLGGDPTMRQALAIAQQRAINDYDTWAERNPGVDRPAAIGYATKLQEQYQNVAFEQMKIALPRPAGYQGSKAGVTAEVVTQARAEIARQLEAKQIGQAEASRQFEILESWEVVLAKAAAQATAAPPPKGSSSSLPSSKGRTQP